MAFLTLPLAWRSERRYRALRQLPQDEIPAALPSLSIIVPARDEAANLHRLLPSLRAISYPGPWELIVVDDNSSDETASVAEEFGANVLRLDTKPEGWLGKPYACHQGAMISSGDWLLFTDADTIHDSDGPARAIAFATRQRLDGLSIFIKQVTSGALDRLAMCVAFSGLFASLGSNWPLLNGQYVLLRHDTYEKSGGYSAVAGEILEDLALGRHLYSCGYNVPVLRDEHVASVHMYNDKTSLWHGLTRLGAGSLRWLGAGSPLTALFITGVMAPILAVTFAFGLRRSRKWAVASWLVVASGLLPWGRRFGSGWLALLAPFGALLVQIAALWGLARRLFGRGVRWKGREV